MKPTSIRYDYNSVPPVVEKSLVFDETTQNDMLTKAFLSEILITAEASALPFTPNVVSSDTRVKNGVCTAYVRTQLCEHGNLFERLVGYARALKNDYIIPFYDPRMIALYFYELVTVLYLLHSRGIAHHDIKLENILVDNAYYLLLIDFGFACHYTPGTLGYHVCGTPAYAAPEKRNNVPHCFEKSDVWSLGCCFYTMYTGKFVRYDPDRELIDNPNDDIAYAIRSMLAHNPLARLSFAQLRQTALYMKGQKEFLFQFEYVIDVDSYLDVRRTWYIQRDETRRDEPSPPPQDDVITDAESENFVLVDTPRKRSPRDFVKMVKDIISPRRRDNKNIT